MKQKAKMVIRVTPIRVDSAKSAIMDNVNRWRRGHGLPAVNSSRKEFDLDYSTRLGKAKQ